jgi:hypothetical protein
MYVASWVYPHKRLIFEMQPRYFGDLDWVAFLHRDAKDPHAAVYGVNVSADGEVETVLKPTRTATGINASIVRPQPKSTDPALLTTSDTIMCFWEAASAGNGTTNDGEKQDDDKITPAAKSKTRQRRRSQPPKGSSPTLPAQAAE